jgi:hypothetical protein
MTDTERGEYESVIRQLMSEIERLQAVVAKLTGTDDAHSTLRRLYLDETQPSTTRVRAAQAALNVEKPALKPQPAPMDLVAEPVIPLAELVAKQRARADRMLSEPPFSTLPKYSPLRSDGNGDDTAG